MTENLDSITEPNLYQDLIKSDFIMSKIKSKSYAQNVYAALCNMRWQKRELWPVITDQYWSCSWRGAGGIVAELRNEGDYMDWYCSGMREVDYDENINKEWDKRNFVAEGEVTEEIQSDFAKLGWYPVEWPEENLVP